MRLEWFKDNGFEPALWFPLPREDWQERAGFPRLTKSEQILYWGLFSMADAALCYRGTASGLAEMLFSGKRRTVLDSTKGLEMKKLLFKDGKRWHIKVPKLRENRAEVREKLTKKREKLTKDEDCAKNSQKGMRENRAESERKTHRKSAKTLTSSNRKEMMTIDRSSLPFLDFEKRVGIYQEPITFPEETNHAYEFITVAVEFKIDQAYRRPGKNIRNLPYLRETIGNQFWDDPQRAVDTLQEEIRLRNIAIKEKIKADKEKEERRRDWAPDPRHLIELSTWDWIRGDDRLFKLINSLPDEFAAKVDRLIDNLDQKALTSNKDQKAYLRNSFFFEVKRYQGR